MQYTIVMPVFKRSDIIKNSLNSIEKQILPPKEVIVIDNNVDFKESEKLLKIIYKFNTKTKIKIKILKSLKNSGSVARNLGAKETKTEIVAFLDSDVVLDYDYYSILMEYFIKDKNLIAIQGTDRALIEHQKSSQRNNLVSKLVHYFEQFFETSFLLNRKSAYVSPSLAVSHPDVLSDFEVYSQWISTCAGLFKRELFNKYSFPKQFVTYSNNEYLMFSYNLFLKKEGSMIYTNKAKYRDIQTNSGRISKKALLYQIQTYDLYIFLRLFKTNPINLFIFIKSRIGHLIYNFSRLIFYKNYSLRDYFDTIYSIFYPLLHLSSIIKGNLIFYEKKFYKN